MNEPIIGAAIKARNSQNTNQFIFVLLKWSRLLSRAGLTVGGLFFNLGFLPVRKPANEPPVGLGHFFLMIVVGGYGVRLHVAAEIGHPKTDRLCFSAHLFSSKIAAAWHTTPRNVFALTGSESSSLMNFQ